MKKLSLVLGGCFIAAGFSACDSDIGGNGSKDVNNISASHSDASVPMPAVNKSRAVLYTSMDNYEKAFNLKFASEQGPLDGMVPGTGWSTDAEHIAPNICFNTSQVIRDSTVATIRSDFLLDQEKLTDFLNLNASMKASWLSFGINASMNYIKEETSAN